MTRHLSAGELAQLFARRSPAPGAAKLHRKSHDRKLAPVRYIDVGSIRKRPEALGPFCASTYASIEATCPDTCKLKRNGCYVDSGFTRLASDKLNAAARGRTPLDVVLEEVAQIDAAWRDGQVPADGARGGRDLRLHVGGDVPSTAAAILLGGAAERWRARGGGSVWTYTHAWARVRRAAFGPAVSVLASIDAPEQAPAARRQGYAPAVVVGQFPEGKRSFVAGGTRFVPCPAETLKKTCVTCRLCLDVDLHARGMGIAFRAHGPLHGQALVQLGRAA